MDAGRVRVQGVEQRAARIELEVPARADDEERRGAVDEAVVGERSELRLLDHRDGLQAVGQREGSDLSLDLVLQQLTGQCTDAGFEARSRREREDRPEQHLLRDGGVEHVDVTPAVLVAGGQRGVVHHEVRRPGLVDRLEVELRVGTLLEGLQRVGAERRDVDGGGSTEGEEKGQRTGHHEALFHSGSFGSVDR